MKQFVRYLFLLIAINGFCQQYPTSKKAKEAVFATMDQTAKELLTNAKASAVSISIVKDNITYMRRYGVVEKAKGVKADSNVVFEIASVTKTFTGTLVAKAVIDGKINLEDDIRKYMNGNYPNLEYQGTPIKIKDLLTHKSGMLRQFPNYGEIAKGDNRAFQIKKIDQEYSKEKFLGELKTSKPDVMPGTVYQYSNFGPQVCAFILENIYHKSFEKLISGSPKGVNFYRITKRNEIIQNGKITLE